MKPYYAVAMCGRYTLRTKLAEVGELLDVQTTVELPPRYNVAPTQDVPVVRLAKDSHAREIALLRWGLIPSWAKNPSIGARQINARAETVTEKPAFRSAFQRRRCLVPADGFYEWRRIGREKQPHYIRLKSGEPFVFAGLWEIWGPRDAPVHSFTIITTEPNELVRPLHDRMPVVLSPATHAAWLDRDNDDAASLQAMLRPYPSREMECYSVSKRVNSAGNDDAACLDPADVQRDLFG